MRQGKNERGLILIIVMWALMVLMVLAGELARAMRIEGLTTDTYQQDVTTYYLAVGGLHRVLYQVVRAQQQGRNLFSAGNAFTQPGSRAQQQPEEQTEVWPRGDGRWQSEVFGAGGYRVRVVDEGGKINLNRTDEITLRQTFANLGFDMELSQLLTDTIQDWRDPDSLVRNHGAENDYYLSLPIPYPAKDGPFDTPEELLLVRGVTPALFYGREGPALREVFTVYSAASGAVNLLTAGEWVLRAALGVDATTAHELVQRRAETNPAELANLMPGRALNFNLPSVVTIESIGYLDDGEVTRRVSAVVQRVGVNGFRFLRWQDRHEARGETPPPDSPPEG